MILFFLISRESVFGSHYKICSGSSHTISLCLLCDSVYLLCPNTWFMFCVRFSLLSVACVLLGQFRMRVKRRDTDNLVLFCLFSANGYQLMSDEQFVSSYLRFPGIFHCSCNCMCWVAWRRSQRSCSCCEFQSVYTIEF